MHATTCYKVLWPRSPLPCRELAPDAPSAVALMGASITLPEPAVHTLLHTAPQPTDASVIMQLLDSAAEAPDLPRAVRIARAAHRAGALTCYSTHPSDAPAAVPLRTLHVALLPPRLVPCVLLAWLTELAEQPPPSGMRGCATEEAPFVVVTGTAPATEGTRRGSSGSGGSAVVPSLEMWSARDPVAISEASAVRPLRFRTAETCDCLCGLFQHLLLMDPCRAPGGATIIVALRVAKCCPRLFMIGGSHA